ncbi:hypothetical protein [Halalkalibacter oceani]|uniref:hypothetical protein n=1 Tax=Halalkalibacter oceani TaxID=1653776 RepID=UPI0033972509
MNDFKIIKEDMLKSAESYGIKVKTNVPKGETGIYITDDDGASTKVSVKELFPEVFIE